MSHTVTARLNKQAREFNAGDNIGFNIRFGCQYYDRQTKQKEWTNYSAVIFARPGAQADYYRGVLIPDSIVTISGDDIKIDIYNGQNNQSITLELLNARLKFASSPQAPQQQTSQKSFEEDIPF